MNIAAGELDRRIMIQVATETRDAANDIVQEWHDNFELWAKKSDRGPFETIGAQQLVRQYDTVFEVRQGTKSRSIHPESHRVTYKGHIFEIVGITEGRERGDTFHLLTASRPDGVGARGEGNTSGE